MKSVEKRHSSRFELINIGVLISSDIVLGRDAGSTYIYNNITHARRDTHFFLSKSFYLALFFIRYFFNILSCSKVLKLKVVSIPLRAKRVFSILIAAHKYFRHCVYNPNKLIFKKV